MSVFLTATSEALKTIKPDICRGCSRKIYERMNKLTSFFQFSKNAYWILLTKFAPKAKQYKVSILLFIGKRVDNNAIFMYSRSQHPQTIMRNSRLELLRSEEIKIKSYCYHPLISPCFSEKYLKYPMSFSVQLLHRLKSQKKL